MSEFSEAMRPNQTFEESKESVESLKKQLGDSKAESAERTIEPGATMSHEEFLEEMDKFENSLNSPDNLTEMSEGLDMKYLSQDELEDLVKDINPYGEDALNCGSCAIATEKVLSGESATADDVEISRDGMAEETGLTFEDDVSAEYIEGDLKMCGDGSHGIVAVSFSEDGTDGHAFNAYYNGDKVFAIDSQSGTVSEWPPKFDKEVKSWSFARNE
ncbi:MAG: hypothetical protein LBN05_01200 [Oscillospiraceae bacterium]|jgi:hypothetical protein|nr:hypothetical protein [Oscillospiraceae bacterium]